MKAKRRLKYRLIKALRYTNKLTSWQKFASRVGYMGAGFVIAGQWTIEPIFFIIGFTIGSLATITGVVIGVLFSYYVEEIRILITSIFNVKLFPEEIYFLSQMPSEINFLNIFYISIFSLLITFLATVFPSISASRLDPVKALKYE